MLFIFLQGQQSQFIAGWPAHLPAAAPLSEVHNPAASTCQFYRLEPQPSCTAACYPLGRVKPGPGWAYSTSTLTGCWEQQVCIQHLHVVSVKRFIV